MATQRAVMKIDGDAASAIKSLTIVFEKVDQLGTAVNNFGNKAKAGGEKAAKGFKKVAKEVDNVGKKSKNTQTRISKLTRTFQGMAKVAGLVSRAMMFSSRALMQVRNAYMAVTDAARLATQGFTNFGRSMFFFVSLPLIGFFKGLITASVDFEDQMVRVGKTTGLWGESLERVSQGIRALARVTSTSHVDLATMAEQIGQLGITSEAAIVELTELFNMLAVTTNIAASEVATKMGKISNAFGWHLSESRDEVTRLANTINYLENTTAASADEILNALYKIAAVAGTLDISASDAAAFAASLISFGFSAEEAGTAVRNLAYYMSQNTEEIYNAMKGYEKYNTKAKVTTAMNEDFASVIIDISDALEDEEENVNALVNAIEIGNLRGGKALAAFGNAFRSLGQNLANASGEWDRATSLMDEYEKAMSSTKAQMGLLKNNINDVGITIGETLLPFINKIILVMVPAIQDLNKWFGALADKTQMLYIGFALLLVIAGPIVMFLGQMMHGVTLLMMGFGQLIKVFALAAKGIGGIALGFNKLVGLFGGTSMSLAVLVGWIKGVFAFLATSLFGWIAVITVAVVAILKVLQKMGVDIAGFFLKIAESAREWGQKLMETYGTGLAKGFNYVLTLVAWIAEQIAGFFRSSSPPKVGPLKTIDKWGAKLMATYLRGFYLADFDILSGIGRIIEKYLTFGKRGDDSKMASALRNVLKARVALSKLIDIYNKTGAIDASLMAATTKGLGHMTEHVQKLIGLWLEYNRLQQKILELEERRKDVVKGYQAEVEGISGSNMSLEDKVNAIRQAQFARDDELRLIDAETAALEEKSDEMQDQLKWQQKFVDAMMAQDDIMERLNATLDKLSKAMENMGGLGGEIGSAFEEAFVAVEETFDSIVERLDQGRLLWDAFLKGFSGEDLDMNLEQYMDTEQWSDYRSFFELGAKIGEVKDQAVEAWEKITTFAISLKDIWDDVAEGVGTARTALGEIVLFLSTNVKEFGAGSLSEGLGVLGAKGKDDFLNWLYDAQKAEEISTIWSSWPEKISAIHKAMQDVDFKDVEFPDSTWLEDLLGTQEENPIAGWFDTNVAEPLSTWFNDTFLPAIELYGPLVWEMFLKGLELKIALVVERVTELFDMILDGIGKTLGLDQDESEFTKIGEASGQGLIDGWNKTWPEFLAQLEKDIGDLPDWVKDILRIKSPSELFEDIGEMTVKGLIVGAENMTGDLESTFTTLGGMPSSAYLGASSFPGYGGVGGGISVIINDPVVRDDDDLDRLAEMVSDKIAAHVSNQQGYGGQSNW